MFLSKPATSAESSNPGQVPIIHLNTANVLVWRHELDEWPRDRQSDGFICMQVFVYDKQPIANNAVIPYVGGHRN